MPTVELCLGRIDYRLFGPNKADTPTALFVHGFLVNGSLWDLVAERLARSGVRSIVVDWPLGAHRIPVRPDAELSPMSVSQAVLELLDRLDLHDVTLVGNDTGGAICQLALRGEHQRIGGLVLTNCDAFEHFPPAFFLPLFKLARHHAPLWLLLQSTRLRLLRHSPLAFGPLLTAPRSAALTQQWMEPALSDVRIRQDIVRFARGLQGTELIHAAHWLQRFAKPTRLVWGIRDRWFNLKLARRLMDALPQARLDEIDNATTFVPIDQPDAVARAIIGIH
jgi:pimeloyl-ACP methyl ester carboxylesterase